MNQSNNILSVNYSRSITRLALVQAKYRKSFDNSESDQILEELYSLNFLQVLDSSIDQKIDKEFFYIVFNGTVEKKVEIDSLISSVLVSHSIDRLEIILSAILRVATSEIIFFSDIPARVIINEYVNLTNAFFDEEQPNLANGVLDNLARKLRPNEFQINK